MRVVVYSNWNNFEEKIMNREKVCLFGGKLLLPENSLKKSQWTDFEEFWHEKEFFKGNFLFL